MKYVDNVNKTLVISQCFLFIIQFISLLFLCFGCIFGTGVLAGSP